MPDDIQEGSYVMRRGKAHIKGKRYKPTPSHTKLPPVEIRHHGDQNDLGIDTDFSMYLDPTLPTVEEVRGSYGKVFIQSYTCLTHPSLWNRAKMIICNNGYPKKRPTLRILCVLRGVS